MPYPIPYLDACSYCGKRPVPMRALPDGREPGESTHLARCCEACQRLAWDALEGRFEAISASAIPLSRGC
jgi:hydrogenase maturation factor HypF (carbamoyltransferase family)